MQLLAELKSAPRATTATYLLHLLFQPVNLAAAAVQAMSNLPWYVSAVPKQLMPGCSNDMVRRVVWEGELQVRLAVVLRHITSRYMHACVALLGHASNHLFKIGCYGLANACSMSENLVQVICWAAAAYDVLLKTHTACATSCVLHWQHLECCRGSGRQHRCTLETHKCTHKGLCQGLARPCTLCTASVASCCAGLLP